MLTVVDNGEAPDDKKGNVVKGLFGRPSVPDQLRLMAARLEAGEWPEPEHMVVVMGYDDVTVPMVCLPGGLYDGHPYMYAGMLQNASLTCLDDAAFQAFGVEELPD